MAEAGTSYIRSVNKEEMSLRTIYEKRVKRPLYLSDTVGKDLMLSVNEKLCGNASFKEKEFGKALKHYNTGIRFCPQNTDGALQVLCVLVGNRSAINIEFERYDKVFEDLIYLEEMGKYPSSLKYRILWRKAKCYEARGDFQTADIFYDDALKLLTENSNLTGVELYDKIRALKYCKENKKVQLATASTSNSGRFPDIDEFKGNEKYPAASPLIDIKYDYNFGRHAVAKHDISVGTLIVKEDPHVALLDRSRSLTHCQVCFVYLDQFFIPCSTCTNVVFCSNDCKKQAEASFHKTECLVYPTLIGSLDKLMSLRILTQRGFKFFAEQKDKLLVNLDSRYRGLTKNEVYCFDDYDNIIFLHRNADQILFDEKYQNDAIYLLRILKKTNFFPFETDDKVLRDEELFIGRLLLRHCQLITCNIRCINQLKHVNYNLFCKSVEERTQLIETIGIGIFPTLALFNHACEPSIIRYNDKTRMLVRTIKPIKAGEMIYDNYGPNYLFMKLQDRQHTLLTDFYFKCACVPCLERWPMASSLETVIKVPCKTFNCDFIFSITRTRRPRLCLLCFRELHDADIKEITEPIEYYCNYGDKMFQEKKFDDALKAYKIALELKYAHTKRPDLEIVKVQERMEHIFARIGNVVSSQ